MSAADWRRTFTEVGQACTELRMCTYADVHPHLGVGWRCARAAAALMGNLNQAPISSQLQDPPAVAPGHAAGLS